MILAIETASQVCAVALAQGRELVAEYRLNLKNQHARLLAASVEKILSDCRVQLEDLQAIAVSIGPGSFTGLRIGLSFAKGLAFGRELPIVGVPTLQALASQAPMEHGLVCAVLRSRVNEVYRAFFDINSFQAYAKNETVVLSTTALAESLPEGCLVITDRQCGLEPQRLRAPVYYADLSALTIARLAVDRLTGADSSRNDELEPLYLQEFIAGPGKPSLL
ncbi:MAG TPA: tRNA (adenosine(37)-N6)-threonylcarbamoyltransferase complex dimerization subunit type 1 TsaB [bacterium]|nr:tRNA (adenosine(37)-N6)-threonylcarbamoyltransferase complex dimerization subunit type 1 TsaB [bacterium]HPN36515.1 tRNA (adenosine(37)-N6)-threonylcarbamoyltransferase complex dimerization subunit type 1 TsaB [bacterium]